MANTNDFVRSGRDTPGPRDWILDLFGSFVRDFGGWIAVADLLELIEALGIPEASGRSALSRMKNQGEIRAVARGVTRGYELTESAERWFEDGTARILGDKPKEEDERFWVIAAFTVPEAERSIRYQIRTRLQGLGFGQLSGGLMIAPAAILHEAQRALSRAQFSAHVEMWKSEHVGFTPLHELVASAWDLEAISDAYNDYLSLAAALDGQPGSERGGVDPDKGAFVQYMININAWRALPFLDPGIPLAHLPAQWPATEARETFSRLASALRPAAWRHFVQAATRSG